MKIVVVGAGSIGTRHIKNLSELGYDVYAVDINADNLSKAVSFAKGTYDSLDKALLISPDIAFICTYSHDHITPAIKCAENGCHLFIEKPLSLNLDSTEKLLDIVEKKKLISMVGCNMRFHPSILYIHNKLKDDSNFSIPIWGNFEFGFYLPFDKKDYQNSYKARRDLGGNLIFDGIHDLDCAVWFFGEPKEVFCDKGIISSLKIDTEDHAEIMIRFATGAVCTVHMDYLQHGYSRRCKIVCEEGTAVWDFVHGKIGTVTSYDGKWSWEDMPVGIYYNQMYVDEVKYFIDSVLSGNETFNSIGKSLSVLKLALAANKSCLTRNWETI